MSSEYALSTALIPIEPIQLWYADLLQRLECISITEAEDRRAEYEIQVASDAASKLQQNLLKPKSVSKNNIKKNQSETPKDSSQSNSAEPSRGGTPTHESPTEPEDDAYLVSLDPTEWKDQDHYRVLGLAHRRHEATDDEIKRQYRRKCLKHHPDKRGKVDLELDYFACIVKAYEQLSDPVKRRAYDSVDPTFDESIPTAGQASAASSDWKKFQSLFSPVFTRNAHFANVQLSEIPQLGDLQSTKEEVDKFYTFWYNFDSWREFSYLDEEDKERGEDREERRYIEKNNAKKRKERKKEDTTRLRTLVDLAFNNDPRIAKFRQDDIEQKRKHKLYKLELLEKKKKEEQEALDRQRKEKEDADKLAQETDKAKKDSEKREKEKFKKALQKSRKAIETLLDQNHYFITEKQPAASEKIDSAQRLKGMEQSAILIQDLQSTSNETASNQLKDLLTRLTEAADWSAKRKVYRDELERVLSKIEGQRRQHTAGQQSNGISQNGAAAAAGDIFEQWPLEELILLIKSVNMFPAGTRERWEVIARYLNQHYRQVQLNNGLDHPERTGKDVMTMAKDLKKLDKYLKDRTNKKAVEEVASMPQKAPPTTGVNNRKTPADESAPSQRIDAPQWTAEEQKLFEEALRQFGPKETDRWDKISDHVGSRTKKECMLRFKELRDMVAKKKEQQQVQANGTK